MIDVFLQDAIKTRLEQVFSGFAVGSERDRAVKIHKQNLPADIGEDEACIPYVIVRLMEGGKEDETAPHSVKVIMIVGVHDDSSDMQGHHDVLNIMRKIEMELFKVRVLEGKYEIVYPFKWVLQDEDIWPFFYGAIETNWNLAFIERECDALWQDQV